MTITNQRNWETLRNCGLGFGIALALLLHAGCSQPAAPEPEPPVAPQPIEVKTDTPPPTQAVPAPLEVEPAVQQMGPRISFTALVHDFGEVSPRSKHTCEFRFKNTGTATLKLKPKIVATCGCTVPVLNRVNYGPGQSGVIKVSFAAGTSVGSIQKSMTVHCNDPDQAQVRLAIKAKVVQRVACEPQRLELRLRDENGGCPPITLQSKNGVPFSISRVTCSGNAMTVAFDPNAQAQTFTLQPRVDLEKLEKRLAGYLLVDLTHPECKQVRIQYNTLRAYQFKPAYVMVLSAEPNKPVTRQVELINNYGEDFDILSVSSQRGMVKLLEQEKQRQPDSEKTSHRLQLSLTPPTNLKRGRMFVDVVKVELSNGESLRLNCRGVYRRQAVNPGRGIAPVRRR